MNGNFRKPEFVKRYEYTYYDLETPLNATVLNDARQVKGEYRFNVDNSSEANPIDWYNAYLEVNFQLVTLADCAVGITAGANNGNQDATTTNGHTFIKEIQVECNGISVYTNMRANESSNALALLKYTKSYADSVGQDQLFYVDTSTGTTEGRPAQLLYNEGFAKKKDPDRCCKCKQNFNSFESVFLLCGFQESASPKYQNKNYHQSRK